MTNCDHVWLSIVPGEPEKVCVRCVAKRGGEENE